MGISQKIKTIIYPIIGLDLSPPTPEAELRIEGDLQPTLSLLIAKAINGTILLEGTEDGALKVAPTGSGNQVYEVETGTAADTYNTGDTFEYTEARNSWDLKLETTAADISFQNSFGGWGDDIFLAAGSSSIEFSAYGIKVKNHTTSDNTVYQIVSWY